jgi:hypothetical protein
MTSAAGEDHLMSKVPDAAHNGEGRQVNPFAKPRFARVCPEMLDGELALSPRALKSWCCLRMSVFGGIQFGTRGKGQFFATYDELAKVFGCSRRQAVTIMEELERQGWVHVPRRAVPRKDGGWANVYVLTEEPRKAAELHARNVTGPQVANRAKPQVSARVSEENCTPAPNNPPSAGNCTPPVQETALQGRDSSVESPSFQEAIGRDTSVASLPSDRELEFVTDSEAGHCGDDSEQAAPDTGDIDSARFPAGPVGNQPGYLIPRTEIRPRRGRVMARLHVVHDSDAARCGSAAGARPAAVPAAMDPFAAVGPMGGSRTAAVV